MKITQKIIDDLEKALDMRKKNGDPVWDDGDEIDVCVLVVRLLLTNLLVY